MKIKSQQLNELLLNINVTDAGFALIESQMRSVLALGVSNGLYASYTITTPRVSDVAQNLRAQRVAGDFPFTAVLQGAIHAVKSIRGTVTV